MKVGEKLRVFIPSSLAYGERGIPGVIPPDAPLVFDIEIVDEKLPTKQNRLNKK